MAKELEQISHRIDKLVDHLNLALNRTQTEIASSSQQSRNLQKDVNKLHETISNFQKDIQNIIATQESLKTNVEKILSSISRIEFPRASSRVLGNDAGLATDPLVSGAKTKGAKSSEAAAEQSSDGSKLKMAEYLKQKKSVFDVRVLNAFINAVKATTQILLMQESKFIRPNPLPPGTYVSFAHAARMKLSKGEGSGYMGVAFKANHINSAVATIFGISVTEITAAMLNDLTKEFCNQVFGQAKTALQKEGIKYAITYPEIAMGSQLEIRNNWGDPYLSLLFELGEKEFFILFW